MLKEIVIAIQSYSEAHRFIRTHRLWRWILIPGAVYAVLFCTGIYFFGKSATGVIDYLTNMTGLSHWIQKIQNSLVGFLFTFAGIILWIILMLFYFSLFKYVILIIGTPVFTYLSRKTEAILNNREYTFRLPWLFRDMGRSLKLVLRNIQWQTFYYIALLLMTLIPVAGWITPLIAIFTECYYYGFSMLDYSCARHQITPARSVEFISRHRGLSIGNGMVFYFMHVLIGPGWVLAPAYAVIAANLSLHKVKNT